MVEEVLHGGVLLAIIVSHRFQGDGIHFFSPPQLYHQLAYMKHPAGREIPPHVHNPVPREVLNTQEVLFIRAGKLRVDFYDDDRSYLQSRVLEAGDIILLTGGGHGFEVLEDLEMFEVKQGPYVGEQEKTKFAGVDKGQLKVES